MCKNFFNRFTIAKVRGERLRGWFFWTHSVELGYIECMARPRGHSFKVCPTRRDIFRPTLVALLHTFNYALQCFTCFNYAYSVYYSAYYGAYYSQGRILKKKALAQQICGGPPHSLLRPPQSSRPMTSRRMARFEAANCQSLMAGTNQAKN